VRRRGWIYWIVPIVLAAVFFVEWGIALLRGPRPAVGFTFAGEQREAALLSSAVSAGGERRLEERALATGFQSPGLVVWDRGLHAAQPSPPGGGSPFASLETLKDLAWFGSTVVLGYHALAETDQAALGGCAETAGIRFGGWIGAYVPALDAREAVPEVMRRSWERGHQGAWRFAGPGVVVQRAADGAVFVLRRGIELGNGSLRVAGGGPLRFAPDGSYAGWFMVLAARQGTGVTASFRLDLTLAGKTACAEAGIPAQFPAATSRPYGTGRVWALAGDFAARGVASELIGPMPVAVLQRIRTLDSPDNGLSLFQRILVPLASGIAASAPRLPEGSARRAAAAPAAAAGSSAMAAARAEAVRAGRHYLERKAADGAWKPWFVQGVDLGASVPGSWATEPPVDDEAWLDDLSAMAAAGFDAVRVYTLLPPAFYRALARFNAAASAPLYLFQGIWLEDNPPGHDLLDARWHAEALAEADRCVDAVYGAASIPPRPVNSWGEYRIDVRPWLAGFLVGRELLPEEVEATTASHPAYRWRGTRFTVAADHPVESFLAEMADRVQGRQEERYGDARPVGFISWPTLDPLHHPGEWDQRSGVAPYHDRYTVDFRLVERGPAQRAGFFVGYHVYPNYPDFMTRDSRYDIPDPTGMARYGAYIDDLLPVLPPVPFIVAEFGLSTGYGKARIHPEGLDHGGLTEEAQAAGLVALFKTMAARGAAGGMVFEWHDEWSKKTWTTEPFMIPYARHALWHNAIDPEQNYGIVGWESAAGIRWTGSAGGVSVGEDTDYLYVRLDPPGPDTELIEVGIDTVGGGAGQRRLDPDGPLGPQGSEFEARVWLRAGRPIAAHLLVAADYDRASGKLFPRPSDLAGFTSMAALTNPAMVTEEGMSFPELHEDGSALPLDGPTSRGLAGVDSLGRVVLRLPWSRLNFSDPSSAAILLDGRADARSVSAQDALATARALDIGVWVQATRADGSLSFLPGQSQSLRAPVIPWGTVQVRARPKQALAALSALLHGWRPLAMGPWR
jgi:hypothetical protein